MIRKRTSKRPRFGLSLPARTLSAVDLPMPLVPTKPSTCPGRGMGSLRIDIEGDCYAADWPIIGSATHGLPSTQPLTPEHTWTTAVQVQKGT